jgi:hypothetical protein
VRYLRGKRILMQYVDSAAADGHNLRRMVILLTRRKTKASRREPGTWKCLSKAIVKMYFKWRSDIKEYRVFHKYAGPFSLL